MKPIFFFGTLRDLLLLSIVIGRRIGPDEAPQARAHGWQTWQVRNEAYPMLRQAEGTTADGLLFRPATDEERAAILFYEEAEYALTTIVVETATGTAEAVFFDATGKIAMGDAPWCFDQWTAADRPVALEAAAELMPLRRTVPVEEIDTVWPGIMNRARQRARAAAETPVLGGLRTAFDAGHDVEWLSRETPLSGYLAVENHTLRHRRFDGTMSPLVERMTVAWGDAVTVLPYDPVLDRVLLIEQFRPGPAAR
ncbi:MAG: gamma-glutamylcyclotransferase, partial [Pseudomonadota bacterium]